MVFDCDEDWLSGSRVIFKVLSANLFKDNILSNSEGVTLVRIG